jgi:hypothetical protein
MRPWPALEDLLRAPARHGVRCERDETLEYLGRRLRGSGRTRATAVVEDYARLRSGGHGRREELEPRIRAETEALARGG